MDPIVRAQHTPAVHAAVARAVGVTPERLRTLGGFESFVYEASVDGTACIVKATWHGRRTTDEIGAELHFINYLYDGGAEVCRALPLATGELIATVRSANGAFHVCAFEKAHGGPMAWTARTEEVLVRWGTLAGRFHRLGASYPGPPASLRRPSWENEYAEIDELIAPEPIMHRCYEETVAAIRRLPRDRGAFGPMHTDLHSGNIFWQDGAPRVFDFDDMLDFWFVADIAIILYYGALDAMEHGGDPQTEYDRIRAPLLRGYGREYTLPQWSHDALPLFLALREHTLRAVILRSVPPEDRTEPLHRFIEGATERIRAGVSPLGLSV